MLGRMSGQLAAGILTILALSGATKSAFACTPAPGWPHEARIDAAAAARQMVAAAAFIDVAEVVQFTSDVDFMSRTQEAWIARSKNSAHRKEIEDALEFEREGILSDGAVRIHFVVRENLKGSGAPEFTLNGSDYAKLAGASYRAPKAVGLNDLAYLLNQQDYADWAGPGTCEAPIVARQGQRYLVFRDADGRLLRSEVSVNLRGHQTRVAGPAATPVVTDHDPWLRLIRSKLPTE